MKLLAGHLAGHVGLAHMHDRLMYSFIELIDEMPCKQA